MHITLSVVVCRARYWRKNGCGGHLIAPCVCVCRYRFFLFYHPEETGGIKGASRHNVLCHCCLYLYYSGVQFTSQYHAGSGWFYILLWVFFEHLFLRYASVLIDADDLDFFHNEIMEWDINVEQCLAPHSFHKPAIRGQYQLLIIGIHFSQMTLRRVAWSRLVSRFIFFMNVMSVDWNYFWCRIFLLKDPFLPGWSRCLLYWPAYCPSPDCPSRNIRRSHRLVLSSRSVIPAPARMSWTPLSFRLLNARSQGWITYSILSRPVIPPAWLRSP